MPKGIISGIEVCGIASCVPANRIDSEKYYEDYGRETVDKFIALSGVEATYKALDKQTASDLAFEAANKLLDTKGIDKAEIGILIFMTQAPDYFMPATAFVLQKRLGLPTDCICFDVNLACSAYVNGMATICSMMKQCDIKYGLLLTGDTSSKKKSFEDHDRMLLGDAGSATLLKMNDAAGEMPFILKSNGNLYENLIIPAGGARNPDAPKEKIIYPDGIARSKYDIFMNGVNVFAFATTEPPRLIKEFLAWRNEQITSYDGLILHQANKFILKQIAKKVNIDFNLVPLSMRIYGNTSSSTLPLTMSYEYGEKSEGVLKLILSGFGVGLSWGVFELIIKAENIMPVFTSSAYFEENLGIYN